MSTLLDSLRRVKQADAETPHPGAAGRQVETILATLGYARRQRHVRVLRYAIGGVTVASVALLGWIMSERSASMPPDTPVPAHLTEDDAGSPAPVAATPAVAGDPVPAAGLDLAGDTVPRPVPDTPNSAEAGDQPPSGVTIGAASPVQAAEGVDRDRLSGVSVDPEPVAPESRADDLVPRTVDAVGPGGSVTQAPPGPGDLVGPSRPIFEPGLVVSEVFARALALQRAGDIVGAIAEYQTLLSDGAGSAQVHNNLGLLYQAQSRFDDAARELERATALDPRPSRARNNLGVVRMRQARYEDAAAAFRDARRLDGANLDARVNLALALQAAGDRVGARRTLVDALSVDARHGPKHYNLARLCELDGDVSRAVEHYERFVEYSGAEHADLVETVRDRIAALGGGPVRR